MVDLNELIAIVRTDLGELIRSKSAEIRLVGPLPTIWGDSDRIRQLLANLIANGLKYNRSPGPRVEIGAIGPDEPRSANADLGDEAGENAMIVVKDNGIGIDPQFHKTIFQLFRRLHTQEEYEGTGAGLAICSTIVQAHGGRIWVESTPGRGCDVLYPAPTSPGFHNRRLRRRRTSPRPSPGSTRWPWMNTTLSEFHILLIEDSRADAKIIERALREGEISHRLTVIPDGRIALDYLFGLRDESVPNEGEPDLILLDLNLPGLDGCQVLTQIKSDPYLRIIPVIVLTTSQRDEDVVQTYQRRSQHLHNQAVRVFPVSRPGRNPA